MAARGGKGGSLSEFTGGTGSPAPKAFGLGDPAMPREAFNKLSPSDQRAHVEKMTLVKPLSERFPAAAGEAQRSSTIDEARAKRNKRNPDAGVITEDELIRRGGVVQGERRQRFTESSESKGPSAEQLAKQEIASKIAGRHAAIFGHGDEEPAGPTTKKTTDVLGAIRGMTNKLDAFHGDVANIVDREASEHERRAAELGHTTPEAMVHSGHAAALRQALNYHLRGIKEVGRSGRRVTRPDLTTSNVVGVKAATTAAGETMAGSGDAVNATGVANLEASRAASKLTAVIKGMARTPLGKLGILPDIKHHELVSLTANAANLDKPAIDYSKSEPDYDEKFGYSKPGHVWVGTHGGLKPTRRQVKVHPDTLTEIMGTLRNGKPRTKKDPDYLKVREAIADVRKSYGGSGSGVYKGSDAAGLPVKMEQVTTNIETKDKSGRTVQTPTPVEDIPKERRVIGPDGKAVPGFTKRPMRGGPKAERLTPEQVQTVRAASASAKQAAADKIAARPVAPYTGVTSPAGTPKKPSLGKVEKRLRAQNKRGGAK